MKQKQRLSDLKVTSGDQLEQELMNLKKEQFNLRFQRATGQLENTARVRQVRRDIARIKTIAAQKRPAPAGAATAAASTKTKRTKRAQAK